LKQEHGYYWFEYKERSWRVKCIRGTPYAERRPWFRSSGDIRPKGRPWFRTGPAGTYPTCRKLPAATRPSN